MINPFLFKLDTKYSLNSLTSNNGTPMSNDLVKKFLSSYDKQYSELSNKIKKMIKNIIY